MNKKIIFHKYQGTGNDFIMIDNRFPSIEFDQSLIAQLCDRRFGIGGDGLILLQNKFGYDFEMKYYNADGRESTMCGNGGRCIVQFAHDLHIAKNETEFLAIDGPHKAFIEDHHVKLKMMDVEKFKVHQSNYVLNTGSPHYVIFESNIDKINLVEEGSKIRYSPEFPDGINVNFVEITGAHSIYVRTYERGVEDETYSCGTGVVAASLCFSKLTQTPDLKIQVITKGGNLAVEFEKSDIGFENIFLIGPAQKVFEGEYTFI